MSLIGMKAEAAEHMVMSGKPTAEIQAISAKVGVAASPSQPAKSTACPSNEAAFPLAANIVISGPPVEFAVSNGFDTKTLARAEGEVRVTSVTGFQWGAESCRPAFQHGAAESSRSSKGFELSGRLLLQGLSL
ncbi:hypothetical protein [Allomesorhizobium camelthorni]|uniref:Uncharacterized protein n=1 Tax=Allomesorhizobium camelthorni TaxID=475069 RepID=A0A6G4W900_9HYPH|nr:hypothetical protein [Mesorhizobium camelthorni]NGO51079.1 hypothetical protein [Mesorhizobium camelthorni]